MKKLVLGLGILGFSISAFAQKAEVVEAKKSWDLFQAMSQMQSLDKNLKILGKGLTHTDNAIINEKTNATLQPWALRASIASAISVVDTVNVENSIAKQKIAEEAIEKAKSLDTKKEEEENLKFAQTNISNAVQARAVRAYNNKDYATAYRIFTEITEKNPMDITMFLNAGVSARLSGDYVAAVKNLKKVASFNVPESKNLLLESINIQLVNLKDTAAAMATADEALLKFVDDPDFVGVQTDVYIKRGEIEKSQLALNKLISKDNKKSIYHFLLGETYYKQALLVQDVRVKLDNKKIKEYNALTAKMTEFIDKSLPYFKTAQELDPKAVHVLEQLKQVYAFKNDTKSYEAVKKALDELPKN